MSRDSQLDSASPLPMMIHVSPFRGMFRAFLLLMMSVAAPAIAQQVLPAEPVEILPAEPVPEPKETSVPPDPAPAPDPQTTPEQPAAAPVVIEAEISDEKDLATAKARDAKADAKVETVRDRATKPKDTETAVRLQI